MFAVRLHQPGGPEQLVYEEVPTPSAGPGQVLVKLRCAALNRRDVWIRIGRQMSDHLPLILGSDGAGVVSQVGQAVTRVKPGDDVVILPTMFCGTCRNCMAGQHSLCDRFERMDGILGGPSSGTYAQYVVVPELNVFARPEALSWEESGAFPLAGLTAYRMIVRRARVHAGEQVLIHGIGGGVATFALQIARANGARVMVTSSSEEKLSRARELGAEATVNYRDPHWEEAVKDWTAGLGTDVVVETVGAATWSSSVRLVRRGGRIAICGTTTGSEITTTLRDIYWNQVTVLGSTMGTASEFAELIQLLESGQVRPVVDRVFPLAEAAAAHLRMDQGEQLGKIVLSVPDD